MKRTAWVLAAVLLCGACGSSSTAGGDRTAPTTTRSSVVEFPASAQLAVSHKPRAPIDGADVPALVAGNSQFAFDLYQQLAAGAKGNLVLSPASISNALAMVAAGARGDTRKQMDAALHFTLPESKLHDACNALDQMLAAPRHASATAGKKATPLKLEQTDAVWGQRGYPFLQAYLDLLARDYGAGLRLADFANAAEAERVKINTYVANATHGRIKELFDKGAIDVTTRLVLVNAIWFKGSWATPFDARSTAPHPFHRLDGSTVNVSMMHGGRPSIYLKGAGYQAVSLPYVGGATMVIVAPDPGKFASVEKQFGASMLTQFDRHGTAQSPELSMPKFDFSAQYMLNDTLSAMGMPDAFDGAADFSGIDGGKNLQVSTVVHKATIKVDEKGTEAAAATGVAFTDSAKISSTPTLVLDHPFLFAIRDDRTGAILFTGRVLDPSAS